jgi:DNA-binding MarR family transcriptional regulator
MTQLERTINIAKYENIHEQTVVNVIFTYHWSNQKIKEALNPYQITPQQYNVLRILKSQYPSPCTINLIRARILDKMSDTSRIVDRLLQKGLIEKKVNAYDRRAVDIVIADSGLALLKKVSKEVSYTNIVSDSLTEEEAKELNRLLDKLRY